MKKKLVLFFGFVLGLSPFVALAQVIGTSSSGGGSCGLGNGGTASIFGLLCQVGNILNAVIPVAIALGVVYFVWGVITYFISDDEEAKSKGRDRIIYGIIGLAVIIGMWGLVNILRNTFGLNNTQQIELPTVPTVNPIVQ